MRTQEEIQASYSHLFAAIQVINGKTGPDVEMAADHCATALNVLSWVLLSGAGQNFNEMVAELDRLVKLHTEGGG
jgi:hypothetical protein